MVLCIPVNECEHNLNSFSMSGLGWAGAAPRGRGFRVLGVRTRELQQLDWYMLAIEIRLRIKLKTFLNM